jgi:hypothetical protein
VGAIIVKKRKLHEDVVQGEEFRVWSKSAFSAFVHCLSLDAPPPTHE